MGVTKLREGIEEMTTATEQKRDLISLSEKQIRQMDNSTKYAWAKELGYTGFARTPSNMLAIEQYLISERERAIVDCALD